MRAVWATLVFLCLAFLCLALSSLKPGPGVAQPTAPLDAIVARARIVWIPGGWFVRGSDDVDIRYATGLCLRQSGQLFPGLCSPEKFMEEGPRRRVWVSRFGIDRMEVTHASYERCMLHNACAPPRVPAGDRRISRADHPVSGVTWDEAVSYCRFRGGRLPTEAEWERAARGHDARRFPWGRHYNSRLSNHGRFDGRPYEEDGFRYAAPVGSYIDGASPFGLLDMAGNVWEWTRDLYGPEAYPVSPDVDPRGPEVGGERIVRGGSWRSPPYTLRVAYRDRLPQVESTQDLGFRCAYARGTRDRH